MNVAGINLPVIVHEINHVIFHLSKQSGLEVCFESQEWIICMLEYLFDQCSNI